MQFCLGDNINKICTYADDITFSRVPVTYWKYICKRSSHVFDKILDCDHSLKHKY